MTDESTTSMALEATPTTTTTYYVRVVGTLWCGVEASQDYKVHEPMELPQADNETDAEYEIRMVQCAADHQTGDFASVDAWEIERVVRRYQVFADGTRRKVETSTTILAFDEDAEMTYMDAQGDA